MGLTISCPNCEAETSRLAPACEHCGEPIATRVARTPDQGAAGKPGEVVITKIDIPFWSLVNFLLTVSIAMIPAAVILGLVGIFAVAVFGGVMATLTP